MRDETRTLADFKVGDKVKANGYEGTVVELDEWIGALVVGLPGGQCVVHPWDAEKLV